MNGLILIVLFGVGLVAVPARADEQQDRANAAYARLHAKQLAATQPATISTAELQEMESELTALRAENAKLRALLEKAAVALQQVKGEQPAEKKARPVKLPVVPPYHRPIHGDTVAMPAGSPLDFTLDMGVDSVGWVTVPRVVQVIDGNNAIIEIIQGTPDGQRLIGRERQVLMRGVSTKAMADDTRLTEDQWPGRYFQVTGTDKVNGTTYFVIEPVKQ